MIDLSIIDLAGCISNGEAVSAAPYSVFTIQSEGLAANNPWGGWDGYLP